MKITTMVPIKLNNERLPGKNTMLMGDRPLIHYILTSLLGSKYIDEIVVYCSDEAICDYLIKGVTFLKRPEFLDEPTSNFTQIFDCFSREKEADIYLLAHATAPFIKTTTIDACIEKVLSKKYDSAFTATKIQDFLWEDGMPINFDAANLPRSQDLKPIFRETSGLYVFTKEVFKNDRRRIGKSPFIQEVSFKEAIDINHLEDFMLAEVMLKANLSL